MSQLPEHLISNISSYNSTTYAENEIHIEFSYDDDTVTHDPTGNFTCAITIRLDTNIAAYWRRYLAGKVSRDLYYNHGTSDDFVRQEINAKLKKLPDYNTIFGNIEENGLVYIDLGRCNEDMINFYCWFYYKKEADDLEDDYFYTVDFTSDKGLKMRKAAAFLVAHTIVRTLKYIIPTPETRVQDSLTFDEDGNRINQKGEYFSDRNLDIDYKLHKKDKRIYSLDFWLEKVSYDIKIQNNNILPKEEPLVKFTLVNNMRLPITRGRDGAFVNRLKF